MEDHFKKYQDAEKKLRQEEARYSQVEEQLAMIRQRENDANAAANPISDLIKEKQIEMRTLKRIADEAAADINALKNEIANSQENVDKANGALERERQKQSTDQK